MLSKWRYHFPTSDEGTASGVNELKRQVPTERVLDLEPTPEKDQSNEVSFQQVDNANWGLAKAAVTVYERERYQEQLGRESATGSQDSEELEGPNAGIVTDGAKKTGVSAPPIVESSLSNLPPKKRGKAARQLDFSRIDDLPGDAQQQDVAPNPGLELAQPPAQDEQQVVVIPEEQVQDPVQEQVQGPQLVAQPGAIDQAQPEGEMDMPDEMGAGEPEDIVLAAILLPGPEVLPEPANERYIPRGMAPLWTLAPHELEDPSVFCAAIGAHDVVQDNDGLGWTSIREVRHFSLKFLTYRMMTPRIIQGTQLRAHLLYFEAVAGEADGVEPLIETPFDHFVTTAFNSVMFSFKTLTAIAKEQNDRAPIRGCLRAIAEGERIIRDGYWAMPNRPSLAVYEEKIRMIVMKIKRRLMKQLSKKLGPVPYMPRELYLPLSRRQAVNSCLARHLRFPELTTAHRIYINGVMPYSDYWRQRDEMELRSRNNGPNPPMPQAMEVVGMMYTAQRRTWVLLEGVRAIWAEIEAEDGE